MKALILKLHTFFRYNILIISILLLAFSARAVYSLLIFPPLLEKKGEELGWTIKGELAIDPYPEIAKNIVAGKGYVDNTNRINFERLPLYTYFLVSIYKIWGTELWKTQLIQSIVDTLSCLLIFLLSMKIFKTSSTALLASLIYALYFKMISIVSRPFTEPFYIFLLLLFLYFLVQSFEKKIFCFFSGFFLGLLTLTKSITLFFPIIVLSLYFLKEKKSFLGKGVVFLFCFLITILPLFVRNYLLTGKVFLSTGSGKMLYMGTIFDYSKNFRLEEKLLIKEINSNYPFPYDIEVDNHLRKLALQQIFNNPWDYLKKVIYRIYLFWTYPDYSTPMMALKTIFTLIFNAFWSILAGWGFYLAQKNKITYLPFLLTILYIYIIYVLSYSYSRYSLPLFPMLFMFSSYALTNIFRSSTSRFFS